MNNVYYMSIIITVLFVTVIIFFMKKDTIKNNLIKSRATVAATDQINQCKLFYQGTCSVTDDIIFNAAKNAYVNGPYKIIGSSARIIKYVEPNIYDIGFYFANPQQSTDYGHDKVRFTFMCNNNNYICISHGDSNSGLLISSSEWPATDYLCTYYYNAIKQCMVSISTISQAVVSFYQVKFPGTTVSVNTNQINISPDIYMLTLNVTPVTGQPFTERRYFTFTCSGNTYTVVSMSNALPA